ncbi:MAG: DUF3365 domain-containing protein, partial [Candidatus Electrothrix sp. AUS1_2]|nr:DUF3365 domain-containing protein [Candidatus Electrothrix sp. AUS1_2]
MRPSPVKTFYFATLSGVALWTALVALSLSWNIHVQHRQVAELVMNEARSHFNRDQAFRFWAAMHGGVYVPVTEGTPPDPKLRHLPERDITTPSGKKLTLMNPASILHQMLDQFEGVDRAKGRITSLRYLNPDNAPDDWEKKALQSLEQGAAEVAEYTEMQGEPYLRLMRPMIADAGCLQCHAEQGYQEGDVRGGVAISFPLEPFRRVSDKVVRRICLVYALIWLSILPVFYLFSRKMRFRLRERIRHEAELEEWAELFKHARWGLALSKNGMFTLDILNPAFANMHGLRPDELLGQPYLSLVEKNLRDEIAEQLELFQNEENYSFETRHARKTGGSFPVEVNITFVPGSGGKKNRRIINVRDISERKEAVRLIAQAHDEWQLTFDAINEIIFFLDPDLMVLRANRAAEVFFHAEPGGLAGRHCFEIFREESLPCDGCPALRSIQERKTFSSQMAHRDNEQSNFFLVSSAPLFDETGRVTAVVCLPRIFPSRSCLEIF